MPNRIPTPGVSTPAVRKSPAAQVPAKPTSIGKAEAMFKSMKPSGNITKDKESVAKKTGVWPNGATN